MNTLEPMCVSGGLCLGGKAISFPIFQALVRNLCANETEHFNFAKFFQCDILA